MKYIIGSRGSKLALVQSNYVCSRLNKSFPEHEFHVEVIKTKGDLILDRPLNQIGDKGLFVTEIENKLLTGDIHLAVHSMKDMPAIPASGLMFSKAWTREDPRDALILREKTSLKDLPLNAVIATGSIRRSYQLKNLRPDIQIVDIRGNVDTRIRKMNDQKLDGLVLAAAGLHRLGLKDLITHYFSSDEMVSAPAQGILAIEVKCGSDSLLSMLNQFSDNESEFVANAERTFLRLIDGDCHVPIGAICTKNMNGNMYTMKTMYGNSTTSRVANATVQGTDPVKMAEEAVNIIKQSIAGTVTLVGAGPGDVGLITVKGLDALKNADCVIYDRLASPRLLNECKDRCEKIYVGKASSNHTMKQDDINQLLVKKSMQYESVVRLKGGDVYVFGRGGEEAITLFENKIPFEVIPGISSSIAGLAYAGIPITHRGIATGFHVVTAHNQNDELADIDFNAMAQGQDTCVFLMGLSKLSDIVDGFLEVGKSKHTPIAVISNATRTDQRTCISTLEMIKEDINNANIISPAIIVVGEVIKLRKYLNFFEQKPLTNKVFLYPQVGSQNNDLINKIEYYGGTVDTIPIGTITYIKVKISLCELKNVDWIVFTSKNAVHSFMESLFSADLDVRSLSNIKCAVIGKMTEACLLEYGVRADLVPDNFHSEALLQDIKSHINATSNIWYIKGENASEELLQGLHSLSKVTEKILYRNSMTNNILLEDKNYYGIIYTCASSVERLDTFLKTNDLPSFSIGPKTTAKLRELQYSTIIEAVNATYDDLITCIIKFTKESKP